MAELGQTNDPRALVPGNAEAVTQTIWAMQAYGDVLAEAGEGLARIDTQDGWRGKAADQFRERFHGEPRRWTEASTCFHAAAGALKSHVSTLEWAQRQAGEAIELWNQGQAATTHAKTAHDRATAQSGHVISIPFIDPGEAKRQAARDLLEAARGQLHDAGQKAVGKIEQAQDKAPEKPGFWSHVGDFVSDVGDGVEDAAIDTVNGLASVGNAMVEHPGDVATIAGGTLLAGISAGGEGLGVALSGTGVGAIGGVPLSAVSAAGITAGAGIAGVGASNLLNHAANDSRVTPMQASSKGSSGGGASQPKAADLLKNGQEYKGTGGRAGNKLPTQDGPKNGVLYKTDPQTGEVTHYTIYDAEGRALKRVDLVGRPHGEIQTPHVVEYAHDTKPQTGQVFVRELTKQARAAFPWEVP